MGGRLGSVESGPTKRSTADENGEDSSPSCPRGAADDLRGPPSDDVSVVCRGAGPWEAFPSEVAFGFARDRAAAMNDSNQLAAYR